MKITHVHQKYFDTLVDRFIKIYIYIYIFIINCIIKNMRIIDNFYPKKDDVMTYMNAVKESENSMSYQTCFVLHFVTCRYSLHCIMYGMDYNLIKTHTKKKHRFDRELSSLFDKIMLHKLIVVVFNVIMMITISRMYIKKKNLSYDMNMINTNHRIIIN